MGTGAAALLDLPSSCLASLVGPFKATRRHSSSSSNMASCPPPPVMATPLATTAGTTWTSSVCVTASTAQRASLSLAASAWCVSGWHCVLGFPVAAVLEQRSASGRTCQRPWWVLVPALTAFNRGPASSCLQDCGHDSHDDAAIFDGRLLVEDAPGSRWRGLQGDALVALSYDERMELHEEGGNSTHPERPDRIRAVMARLHAAGLVGRCMQLPSRPASRDEIVACHSSGLLVLLDSLSEQARLVGSASLPLNADTYINQYSAECARLSAGSCVEVARAVVQGEARAGVAICRPPGHHAESNTSMGFCLFNNAGIAARAAQAAGAERVLILDWDVHHGNGTQEIFEDDPTVMYVSLHRYDRWVPGCWLCCVAGCIGRGC